MYKLKILLSIFFMVFSAIALSQEPKFIYFDGSSNENYTKEDGSGITNSEKLFQKSLVNGHLKYFIKGELFMVLNHKNSEILNENDIKNTNFSSIDKLKIKVQEENVYYVILANDVISFETKMSSCCNFCKYITFEFRLNNI